MKDAKVLSVDMKAKNINLTFILEEKGEEFANNETPVSYSSEDTNFTIGESMGSALSDLKDLLK